MQAGGIRTERPSIVSLVSPSITSPGWNRSPVPGSASQLCPLIRSAVIPRSGSQSTLCSRCSRHSLSRPRPRRCSTEKGPTRPRRKWAWKGREGLSSSLRWCPRVVATDASQQPKSSVLSTVTNPGPSRGCCGEGLAGEGARPDDADRTSHDSAGLGGERQGPLPRFRFSQGRKGAKSLETNFGCRVSPRRKL